MADVARDCRSPRCSPGPTAAPRPPNPYGSVSHWPDGSATHGKRWENMAGHMRNHHHNLEFCDHIIVYVFMIFLIMDENHEISGARYGNI